MLTDETRVIDKNGLRQQVLDELSEIRQQVHYLLTSATHRLFWERLHQTILDQTEDEAKKQYLEVEKQLLELEAYVSKWIESSVESVERFEFFILAKAQEVGSGDQDKDYYWALTIRRDQLLGLISVLKTLIRHLATLVEMEGREVLEDPVIVGMTEYPIDTQVFLEAEKAHKLRS
jgi:hypothetical protein